MLWSLNMAYVLNPESSSKPLSDTLRTEVQLYYDAFKPIVRDYNYELLKYHNRGTSFILALANAMK